MNKYELFPGVYANQGQTEALDLLFTFLKSDEKAFILCGPGGTGKTTILKKAIANYPGKIGGIAISHKAKKVLGLSIGYDKVMTVASALSIKLNEETGEFKIDEYNRRDDDKIPIKSMDLVVVDEASMISDEIIKEMKKLKKKNAKIIFLGDSCQLPPVGSDKISSVFQIKNKYLLTEKMRQAATSPIIKIGEIINENQKSDNPVLRALKPEDRVTKYDEISGSSVLFESDENTVLDMFVEDFHVSEGNTDYCKMITYNNENHNHPQSVKNLNSKIRIKLWGDNPNKYYPNEMLTAYDSFYVSEKIGTTRAGKAMYTSKCLFHNSEDFVVLSVSEPRMKYVELDHYDRYNHTRHSHTDEYEIYELLLRNNDTDDIISVPVLTDTGLELCNENLKYLWNNCKKLYFDLKKQFANLQYGYAISSHKSQGSTYQCVYVFEDNILGQSNGSPTQGKNQSLYVAVSRPRKKLVMVSSINKGTVIKKTNLNVTFKTISKDELKGMLFDESGNRIVSHIFDEGTKTKAYIKDMLLYKAGVSEGKYIIRLENRQGDFVEI